MNEKYKCQECNWSGYENELCFKDAPEGCVGDTKIELCPQCGSQKVFLI
jgi:predicted RNA-binding Zn-ribbon protein involved in translation (DUF1610 family)